MNVGVREPFKGGLQSGARLQLCPSSRPPSTFPIYSVTKPNTDALWRWCCGGISVEHI